MGGRRTLFSNHRIGGTLVAVLLALVLIGCKSAVTVPPPDPYQAAPTATAMGTGPAAPSQATPTLAAPPSTVQAGQPTPEPSTPTLAAMVNDQPLTLREYQKQVTEWELAFITQNLNLDEQEKREMLAQGRRQVLDVMIEQMLIEQAAAQAGIVLSDAEVKTVIDRDIEENGGQKKFETWLQENQWTYEEYMARQRAMMIASQMFEEITKDVPTTAQQVHARHILVAAEEEAASILSQLQNGGDFAELARKHSLDPSNKESGGDLGFFPIGTLVVPEIEEVAFSLAVDEISGVVQSPMGYHIVQVVERVQDRELTEESWHALREATFRAWVSDLWQAADIEMHIAL